MTQRLVLFTTITTFIFIDITYINIKNKKLLLIFQIQVYKLPVKLNKFNG